MVGDKENIRDPKDRIHDTERDDHTQGTPPLYPLLFHFFGVRRFSPFLSFFLDPFPIFVPQVDALGTSYGRVPRTIRIMKLKNVDAVDTTHVRAVASSTVLCSVAVETNYFPACHTRRLPVTRDFRTQLTGMWQTLQSSTRNNIHACISVVVWVDLLTARNLFAHATTLAVLFSEVPLFCPAYILDKREMTLWTVIVRQARDKRGHPVEFLL